MIILSNRHSPYLEDVLTVLIDGQIACMNFDGDIMPAEIKVEQFFDLCVGYSLIKLPYLW
jgi:hypothetical protein